VVHLVNYDYDDESDRFYVKKNLKVKVSVGQQAVDEVVLRTPRLATGSIPPFYSKRRYRDHRRAGTRCVGRAGDPEKRLPAQNILSVAGCGSHGGSRSTVALSVDASDLDGNPLSCVWR